ncbi:MAG TPA: hypothetical protein VLE46_16195 [Nitrospira sp.]|nr:hypothetical protein [Nitrospira sp.]
MKTMLMAVMAVAVAVTFSAPAFAGDTKSGEKKDKGGHVVVYGEDKDKKSGGSKADETFGDKKEEQKTKK